MQEGIYRLYRTYPSGEQRLVARFIFQGTDIKALEDHDEILADLIPNGRLNNNTLRRLESMKCSPYWRLVNEQDINQGFHEDLVPGVE